MEISLLFCQGLRAEDIARKLSLSGKTVATHKYRMFDKLGIKDTVALARMAAQHGVTEPDASSPEGRTKGQWRLQPPCAEIIPWSDPGKARMQVDEAR
jgi:DNA-binding CsgD family transcriptional regulator